MVRTNVLVLVDNDKRVTKTSVGTNWTLRITEEPWVTTRKRI